MNYETDFISVNNIYHQVNHGIETLPPPHKALWVYSNTQYAL